MKSRKEYNKEYYLKNKEYLNIKRNSHYQAHKEESKVYRKLNIDKINSARRIRESLKRKIDPVYKLKCNMRSFIYQLLKKKCMVKNSRTKEYMGCTAEFLKQYIESKFITGMTWDNIHIDHIIPTSFFSLQYEDEQKKCFNYLNLQPLFITDNLEKDNNLSKSFYELISYDPDNNKPATNNWRNSS